MDVFKLTRLLLSFLCRQSFEDTRDLSLEINCEAFGSLCKIQVPSTSEQADPTHLWAFYSSSLLFKRGVGSVDGWMLSLHPL